MHTQYIQLASAQHRYAHLASVVLLHDANDTRRSSTTHCAPLLHWLDVNGVMVGHHDCNIVWYIYTLYKNDYGNLQIEIF